MKSYNLERTNLVLSFFMFKAMRILVLKFSKFRLGSLLFDVQSDEDSSFKIVKVPKAESIALDDLDEVVSSF